MRKLEQYRVKDGKTSLSAEELNFRFFDLDGRLHQLELLKVSWQEAVAEVQNHGLERINSVIQPILDQAGALVATAQDDLTDIASQWQTILDGWAGMSGTIGTMDASISAVQSDVAALQASIADLLAAPPTPIRFAQMGLVSVQAGIVVIPAGVNLTISKVAAIVGTAPAGGPCSIALKKNGVDDIFASGTLDIADGTNSADTTNLQNNTLTPTDYIRVDTTAGNSAQDLMLVMEF
jgi:hypothetical protein